MEFWARKGPWQTILLRFLPLLHGQIRILVISKSHSSLSGPSSLWIACVMLLDRMEDTVRRNSQSAPEFSNPPINI